MRKIFCFVWKQHSFAWGVESGITTVTLVLIYMSDQKITEGDSKACCPADQDKEKLWQKHNRVSTAHNKIAMKNEWKQSDSLWIQIWADTGKKKRCVHDSHQLTGWEFWYWGHALHLGAGWVYLGLMHQARDVIPSREQDTVTRDTAGQHHCHMLLLMTPISQYSCGTNSCQWDRHDILGKSWWW